MLSLRTWDFFKQHQKYLTNLKLLNSSVVILSFDFNMNYNIIDMFPIFYSQISLHITAVSAFMFCVIQTSDNIYSSTVTFPLRDYPAY